MSNQIHRDLINEQVYNFIKTQIMNNEITPNEKIDVVKLAQTLHVSRTPVASALSRLQHDGYVVILPQSGTFVRNHSLDELAIIYECRARLEQTVVEMYGSRYDHESLRTIHERFTKLGQTQYDANQRQDQLFAIDLDFHALLLSACEPVVRANIINIVDLTKRSRLLYFKMARDHETNELRIKRNIRIHCDIIDALLRGDYQQAAHLVYEDIHVTFDCVKEYI